LAIHKVWQAAHTLVSGRAGQSQQTEWLIDHGEGQLDKRWRRFRVLESIELEQWRAGVVQHRQHQCRWYRKKLRQRNGAGNNNKPYSNTGFERGVGTNFTALAGTGVGANAGTIIVEYGAYFIVGETVKNSGTILINGGGALQINRDTILQGGGKITLSNNSGIGGGNLTNVDNTISGSGTISTAVFVNQTNGVIDATEPVSSYLMIMEIHRPH
jgi:hypothetical protein